MYKKLSNIVMFYENYLEYLNKNGLSNRKYLIDEEYIYQNSLEEFWEQNDIKEVAERILGDLINKPQIFRFFDYSITELQLIKRVNFDVNNINERLLMQIVVDNERCIEENFPLNFLTLGDEVTTQTGKVGHITDIYDNDDIEVEVHYENGFIKPYKGVWEKNFWKLTNN